ncbi:MAG: hypothetical protein AAFY71_01075 [Bacteroidota bacterium]
MNTRPFFFMLMAMIIGGPIAFGQKMDNKSLGKILLQEADSVAGQDGYWQLKYGQGSMLVMTDEANNRMRIVHPITYVADLEEDMMEKALIANFHTALDIKYAISEDIVWAVFIHPLKELTKEQVIDALKQVYQGAMTFGLTYSSTNLVFPAASGEEEKEVKKEEEKSPTRY